MRERALIVLLWAALFVPASLSRSFWNPDEGRYGEVAREVWAGEGAVVPHLAGAVYTQKPPLFFWLAAGGQMLLGEASAPASRLPSLVSTLVTALLLLGMVRRSHGEKEGLFAAAVYLTSILTVQMGQWIGIDSLVTVLVTGCLYLQQYRDRGDRRPAWATAGIYVLLAGIVLAKVGPVFIAVLALAGVAWLRGGWRALFPRHLLWGVPLMLLLLTAWAVPAGRAAGVDYLWGLTGGQAGRISDSDHHRQGFFYYLLRFPPFFLPWLGLLPAAAVWGLTEWRSGGERRLGAGRYLLWFAAPFLVFSFISGKRERYILPLFPAAAAVAGVAAVRLRSGRWYRALVTRPLLVTAGALGVVGIVFAVAPFVLPDVISQHASSVPDVQRAELLAEIGRGRILALCAGLAAALIAGEAILRRRTRSPAAAVCAATVALLFGTATVGLPALDRVKSYEPLVAAARPHADSGTRWGVVKLQPGPFCLALDRADVADIGGDSAYSDAAKLLMTEPDLILFMRERHLPRIATLLSVELETLAARRVGSRKLVAFKRR